MLVYTNYPKAPTMFWYGNISYLKSIVMKKIKIAAITDCKPGSLYVMLKSASYRDSNGVIMPGMSIPFLITEVKALDVKVGDEVWVEAE